MSIHFQNMILKPAIHPRDAAGGVATPVTLDIGSIGTPPIPVWYVGIIIQVGNINGATANNGFEIREGSTDFSGTVISGLAFTALSGSSDNTIYRAGFHTGGPRLRYYQLNFDATGGAAAALVSAVWCLFCGQTPSSATEAGVTQQLFI